MSSSDLGALRSQVCHQAADWLAAAGDSLWETAHVTQAQDTEAVALLTQMVGQLGQEAADAFDRQRWYAATALTRQIVEAHYLMAVFRDDPRQRPRWLKASTNRIEKSFRPARMRQVAGVKPGEYKQHCAWGGHPNPSARWLLPNHIGHPFHPSILVADLAQHLTEAIDLLVLVLKSLQDAGELPSQGSLPATYARWQSDDLMSRRLKLPGGPEDVD